MIFGSGPEPRKWLPSGFRISGAHFGRIQIERLNKVGFFRRLFGLFRRTEAPPKTIPQPSHAVTLKRQGSARPVARTPSLPHKSLDRAKNRRVWTPDSELWQIANSGAALRANARLCSLSLRSKADELRNVNTDVEQLRRYRLPVWKREQNLADALGLSLSELWHYASHREYEFTPHYYRFTIPKRSGGKRLILAPKRRLKAIQRELNEILIRQLPVSEHAHGFRRERSVLSNALPHVGQKVILGMDLKDFFPSVHFGRVRGYLIALGYGFPVATALALLMTEAERETVETDGKRFYKAISSRYCVQGAPTSPGLCNALLLRMDRRLAGVAQKWGFVYTRYADDLSFSGPDSESVQGLRSQVMRIIQDEGFVINKSKTRLLRQGQRQEVTGVVVNDEAGLSRQDRRRLRAALHRQAQGQLDANAQIRLRGKLAYLKMLNPGQYQALISATPEINAWK